MGNRDLPKPRQDGPRKAVATRAIAGAQPSYLSDEEADANEQAIDTVVQALGGRPALLDTLAVAADAPEVEPVLSLLLDPRYARRSLRSICAMANLTVVDLFAAYKKAMITKAHLVAYKAITEAIVPVVEDVMRRAAPYRIPCYGCGGQKEIQDPDKPTERILCPDCKGQGELLQLPDLDRQKLALELAQLVQKAGGLTLQQNNVQLPAGGGGGGGDRTGNPLIDLQHAVRDLLSGPRTPILDAETVEPPEAEGDPVRGPTPDPIPPLGGA